MKIGNLNFRNGLFLAPLAGVTDHPFRRLCVRCGAEYVTTEMISAKAIRYGDLKTWRLGRIYDDERPAAVQLFGSEPEIMAYAASECERRLSPASVDINMGCPMPKIYNNGDGSALMKSPALCGELVAAVKSAVSVPVTVKIRAGIDAEHINAVDVALECEKNGADCVYVHGRTREQLYSGSSDPTVIAAVKAALKIPVVANGDVTDAASATALLEKTGADGVMVARGAMGNPWIFSEIAAALEHRPYTPPTADERLSLIKEHIAVHIAEKGERALPELRKHLSWYIHGLPGSAAARAEINKATTGQELYSLLARVFLPQ
ncbi:MAG: tRNA dihydrouridine synthase DusB [Ruminococcus sp.]|jgi:putative TIM-barrel protein, nifR3 family|nr:tRNA dihydrouridine synthase DusB [Ruminococcus sp.]MDD6300931.1 tRNA dihydrouridine synthase DusB [Ruminococcus sp.]MDD7670948.1 tRNA dihydrouridine synthase DusB [Ruminococcus sp.]